MVHEGKDITDQPIDFRNGDLNDVEVTLTSNISVVTGSVTENNKPVTDCVVILFSDDAARWAFPSRHVSVARPDARGAFTIAGLPHGRYLAIGVPPAQAQDSQNPAALERYRGPATSVTVLEGGKATVALRSCNGR